MRKTRGAIGIRTRIRLFQAISGGAILLMAAAVYLAIQNADYYVTRSTWSHDQRDAIMEIAVRGNRYSEQIAEMLLMGAAERPDFKSAQADLEASLDKFGSVTEGELAFLEGSTEQDSERVEVERLDRMRTLYDEINAAVERALALRKAGRHEEAVQLFRREIENRLDAEFEQLVAVGLEDEIREVGAADRHAQKVAQRLTILVGVALLVALAATQVSGYLLYRSLVGPIAQLTKGAIALGDGDLSYRIGYAGKDELGLLAARFNDMACQLTEHRTLLLAAQSNLETQIHQRTAQLEEVNQRLRELDRLRVQFLADISHELRTPLTILRGEAEVTLRGRKLPEATCRDVLARIVGQAGNMGRLVDDLLFLARAETDTVRFERNRMDLRTVLAGAAREADVLGRIKGLTIEVTIPEAPIATEGDGQRLKQALIILLDNAVKYSESGGTILIGLTTDHDEAAITIRNHGIEIAPEDLPYVFDRFYRGQGSMTQDSSGSGLGLPIAKAIIEKHGGSIALTSIADDVTEVRIRLPLEP